MAVITPQSVIKVYTDILVDGGKCPLAFSSSANRDAYFNRHVVKTISNACYVRKSGRIRINIANNLIDKVNYITFINPGHENKTYYAILKNPPRYINNECYEYTFQIDNFQTYYVCNASAHLAPFCMIDREHASADHTSKAISNPYHKDCWELRTPETLPVSEDLEKVNYELAFDDEQVAEPYYYDGCHLFGANGLSDGKWSPLIYLSDIDWEDLDGDDTSASRPSAKWKNYKTNALLLYDHGTLRYGSSTTDTLYNTINANITIISPGAGNTQYNYQNLLEDLTKWGVTGAILNIVLLPFSFFDSMVYSDGAGLPDVELRPPVFLPNNKYADVDNKLNYYPFTYARIMTPAGDVKEYKWEDFSNLTNYSAHFAAICDIAEKPSLVIAPKNYKIHRFNNVYDVQGNDLDMINVIKFDQIPTAPFSIDAYLAQVSSVAMSIVSNNTITTNAQRSVDRVINTVNANPYTDANYYLTQGALGAAATATRTGGHVTDDGRYVTAADEYAAARQQQLKLIEANYNTEMSATATLQGKDDTYITRNLAPTRPAFAVNQYTPSHGAGFDHFSRYGFCNMIGLSVQLRDDVLDRYDAYFKMYGYKSGRCGIPFIDAFLHGSSDVTKLPTWKTIATGIKSTYLKLAEGEIMGVRSDVSDNLMTWFKSGALIINGDEYND